MRTINCRDDSLADNGRSMWSSMKKRKRCVVICHGFYEWLKKNNGKERIPHYIKRKDGKLMCFAGLWDVVQYEDSEEKLYTFTIITTDPSDQMKFLHDRMPVILNPGSPELFKWLDPKQYTWTKELQSLLKPFDGELDIYPVDQAVGKVGNDSASFIIPVNSTENKKNIVNFFNKQAELAKSPKKPTQVKVKQDDPDKQKSTQESITATTSPPQSTADSQKGVKREMDELSDIEEPATKKQAPGLKSSPVKNTRKMHSATSNGSVSKSSPKKVDNSKKITTFFTKNSA
jgi:putative SOS response-associated peptidase YedK